MNQGKHEELLSMDQESLRKKRATHGHYKAHPEIQTSLKIALVCKDEGKLIKAIQFYKEGPAIQRIIYAPNTPNPSIATLLACLARSYQGFGQQPKAMMIQERCLDMKRAIYATNAEHPEVTAR